MTTALVPAPTIRIDRSAQEFVPVPVVAKDGAIPVVDVTITVALMAKGTRPSSSDWVAIETNPSDATQLGVTVHPITGYAVWGVWVRVVDNSRTYVLRPDQVGWIVRT